MTQLVKMQRPDGKTADVHPDMIADYQKGDYVVVEEKPKRQSKKGNEQ